MAVIVLAGWLAGGRIKYPARLASLQAGVKQRLKPYGREGQRGDPEGDRSYLGEGRGYPRVRVRATQGKGACDPGYQTIAQGGLDA